MEQLHEMGSILAQDASHPEMTLIDRFGRFGYDLFRRRRHSNSPVRTIASMWLDVRTFGVYLLPICDGLFSVYYIGRWVFLEYNAGKRFMILVFPWTIMFLFSDISIDEDYDTKCQQIVVPPRHIFKKIESGNKYRESVSWVSPHDQFHRSY